MRDKFARPSRRERKARCHMPSIQLVEPSEDYLPRLADYRAEMLTEGPLINGGAGLGEYPEPADWLRRVRLDKDEATARPGFVPATVWLGVRTEDGRLVGTLQLRHRLNDYLLRMGGHIGYSVRPSERRRGYAKEMLRLALRRCRAMGIGRVLITCDKKNIASCRTILSAGGRLENEVSEGERITRRYWIDLMDDGNI